MKKKSFLFLAAVTALFANAASAEINTDSELLVLPKYVITAPRQTDAEKKVAANLQALREQANVDALASELPYIKSTAPAQATLAKVSPAQRASRTAKS